MLIVENDDCTLEFWSVVHPEYGTVAQLPKGQDDEAKERQLALARAFAGAPRLLEVCKRIASRVAALRQSHPEWTQYIDMIVHEEDGLAAAIAEAEGRRSMKKAIELVETRKGCKAVARLNREWAGIDRRAESTVVAVAAEALNAQAVHRCLPLRDCLCRSDSRTGWRLQAASPSCPTELVLKIEPDCPDALRRVIEADAAEIAVRRGERFRFQPPVST